MAERVTKVRLSAQVAEYSRAMEEAAKKTREVGSEAEKMAQQREAFNQLGTAALGVGAAMTSAGSRRSGNATSACGCRRAIVSACGTSCVTRSATSPPPPRAATARLSAT